MEIPIIMKNKIKNLFYDKKIYLVNNEIEVESDGNLIEKEEKTQKYFLGNVKYSKNSLLQKEYGLDNEILLEITTDYIIEKNKKISYENDIYKVIDFIKHDSHYKIIGQLCT